MSPRPFIKYANGQGPPEALNSSCLANSSTNTTAKHIFAYNGKAHLRDEAELVADTVPIPAPDSVVRRHGMNYRVTDVSVTNARQALPRFVIDLTPLGEFENE